jgi:hypothetical protein
MLFGLAACSGGGDGGEDADPTGDTGGPTVDDGIDIAGTYVDEFGTEHVVDDVSWTQTYPGYSAWTFAISSYDDEARFVIAQNDPDDPYNAGLWSRFDWTGDLHVCQTAYAAATEAEALATPRADDTDLDGGCGGFAWTDLTP